MKLGPFPGRDWVALILAIGLLVIVVAAGVSIVYATIVNENREVATSASQILTPLFGGILAILGAYVGSGRDDSKNKREGDKQDED